MLIAFESVSLHPVVDLEHEFLLTTKEVADGYGVSDKTVRNHKHLHSDELIEGKHFVSSAEKTGSRNLLTKRTLWTKRGIVRLGFFIKSDQARRFRDFIEDLVLTGDTPPPEVSDTAVLAERDRLKDELLQTQRDLIHALQEARDAVKPKRLGDLYTDAEKASMIKMRKSGKTLGMIAGKTGRSRSGVYAFLVRAGIK